MRHTSADESGDFLRDRLLCRFFSAAHATHYVRSRCSVSEARTRQCILSDGFDRTQRRRVRVHRKAHVGLCRCAPRTAAHPRIHAYISCGTITATLYTSLSPSRGYAYSLFPSETAAVFLLLPIVVALSLPGFPHAVRRSSGALCLCLSHVMSRCFSPHTPLPPPCLPTGCASAPSFSFVFSIL